jgi:hypothetical protein
VHTDTVSAQLYRLNWLLHARVVEAKLRELERAVKAGFDPNEPRVPAGSGLAAVAVALKLPKTSRAAAGVRALIALEAAVRSNPRPRRQHDLSRPKRKPLDFAVKFKRSIPPGSQEQVFPLPIQSKATLLPRREKPKKLRRDSGNSLSRNRKV